MSVQTKKVEGQPAKSPQVVRNIRSAAKKPPHAVPPVPVEEWDDARYCDRETLGADQRMIVIRVIDGQVNWRTYNGTGAQAATDVLTAGTALAAQTCVAYAALESRFVAMVRAATGNEG